MLRTLTLMLGAEILLLASPMGWAGETQPANEAKLRKESDGVMESKGTPLAQEFTLGYSYVGGADGQRGNLNLGNVQEHWNELKYVVSPEVSEGILFRVGPRWERFSFVPKSGVPVPDQLQSTSLIIGADIELSDSWLMRLEIEPGIYSDFDDISFNDLNAPVTMGFSYLVNPDFQWFFGFRANPRANYPVLPGAGFRWKFAEQWTLMFLVPKPRLEYDINKQFKAFVGLDIKGESYRTGNDFGNSAGLTRLNNAAVDYTEARGGAGVNWKVMPGFNVELEGGYAFYRRFDFHNADTQVRVDPAPYVQVGANLSF
jgi:hypothetical protein